MDGVHRIIVVYKFANFRNSFTYESLAAAKNKPNFVPRTIEDPATRNVIFKNGNKTGIAFQI